MPINIRSALVRTALLVALTSPVTACNDFGTIQNGEPDFNTRLLLPPASKTSVDVNVDDARRTAFTTSHLTPDMIPSSCVTAGQTNSQTGADPGNLSGPGLRSCFYGLKSIIDDQYREYKITLRHIVDGGNTLADLLGLGLSTAATATPGAPAKTLFSAFSSAVAGGKSIVDADLLYKQTIVITINEMDADRAQLETGMLTRLNAATPPYTLAEAENDLLAYYEAGTFTHALVSLETRSAANQANCSAQAQNAKVSAGSATTSPAISTGCPATTLATPTDPGIVLQSATGTISQAGTTTLTVASLTATKVILSLIIPAGASLAAVSENTTTINNPPLPLTIDSTIIPAGKTTGTITFTFTGLKSNISVDAIPYKGTVMQAPIPGLYKATYNGG